MAYGRIPQLREFFPMAEAPSSSGQLSVSYSKGASAGSDYQLSAEDVSLARVVIQNVNVDLASSGVQVSGLLGRLAGSMGPQDLGDLNQALALWIGKNPGNTSRGLQVRMLQQRIRGASGGGYK